MRNLAEMIGANQLFRYLSTSIALAIMWALGGDACSADALATTEARTSVKVPTYPVKTSANNRYLVDQNNVPFMIVGDSPQSLIGRMSNSDATLYMANRQRYGINTLWVHFLCNDKTACNADGTTFDGIPPFTTPGDIATPNPAYFDRAAEMLKIAAAHGVTIMLNVIETIGWLDIFRANGPEKAEAFGRHVGNQYKDIPNIIWMYGNDFQTWADLSDDALVFAVAKGIMSADHNHIHTTELNYLSSGSLDDARWDTIVNIDGVYTYYPTYAQILKEYNRPNFKPVFTVEANYEFEHNYADRGSPENLRRQEYWTMLSGATGQLYGSAFTWRLPSGWLSNWRLSLSAGRLFGWRSNLDTPGVIQLSYMKSLFAARRWYDLVPDQDHAAVIDGYGKATPLGTGSITMDTYATAARTPDGTLIMVYLPTIRRITVDMSKLRGTSAAHWYDPTIGNYIAVDASPFANTGTREFTPPGKNHDNNEDWVLVLETN